MANYYGKGKGDGVVRDDDVLMAGNDMAGNGMGGRKGKPDGRDDDDKLKEVDDAMDDVGQYGNDSVLVRDRSAEEYKELCRDMVYRLLTESAYRSICMRHKAMMYAAGEQGMEHLNYFNVLSSGGGNAKPIDAGGGGVDGGDKSGDYGKIMPMWQVNNQLRSRVNQMTGTFLDNGMDIQVMALNAELMVRKEELRKAMLAQVRMNDDLRMLEEISGVLSGAMDEIQPGVPMPRSDEEFQIWYSNSFKTNEEMVIEAALNYNIGVYQMHLSMLECLENVIITGIGVMKSEVINGLPSVRNVDVRMMVPDPHYNNSQGDGCQCMLEYDYISLADAEGWYNYVPGDGVKGAINQKDSGLYGLREDDGSKVERTMLWMGVAMTGTGSSGLYDMMGNAAWSPVMLSGGTVRLLRLQIQWVDSIYVLAKVSKDEGGNEIVQTYYDKKDPSDMKLTKKEKANGTRILRRKMQVVRCCTILGGDDVVEWGVRKWQLYDIRRPSMCMLDYSIISPQYNWTYKTKGMIEELIHNQDMETVLTNKMLHEIAKSGGRVISFDLDQLPDGMDESEAIYLIKGMGVHVYSGSKLRSMGVDPSPPTSVDHSISQTILTFIDLIQFNRATMQDVSGISSARMGAVSGANQLVGVTEMSRIQSGLNTLHLFRRFYLFLGEVLEKHAQHIKQTWFRHTELYENAIGAMGMAHLRDGTDISLMDMGVKVVMPSMSRSTLENALQLYAQSGMMPAEEYLMIKEMMNDSISKAINRFINYKRRKAEAEMRGAAAGEANQADGAAMAAQMKADTELEKVRMMTDAELAVSKDRLASNKYQTDATNRSMQERDVLKMKQDDKHLVADRDAAMRDYKLEMARLRREAGRIIRSEL